jgi:hypothetical protein
MHIFSTVHDNPSPKKSNGFPLAKWRQDKIYLVIYLLSWFMQEMVGSSSRVYYTVFSLRKLIAMFSFERC